MASGTASPRLTRREALSAGALAVAGLGLTSAEWAARRRTLALARLRPAVAPQFASRPDLRIPGLTVAATAPGRSGGSIFIAPYNAPHNAQAGGVIVDAAGSIVWEQPIPGRQTMDLRVQTYRGSTVLTWWEGYITHGHGVGHYVIADTSYRPIATPDAGNGLQGDLHEFRLTDRGTALLTSYVITSRDLRSVGGPEEGSIQDAIFQEIDIASGRVLLEWHSLDHISLAESYWPLSPAWDYVHLNSVAVDHDENLLVSSRNTHAVYKIDRRTGEIVWRLGGKRSDFDVARDARFEWQHDAVRQPDGSLTVFDNGTSVSRALLLDLDERARTVGLTRAYVHPDRLFANSQGNVQLLTNGNVFVGWGAQPYVSEFAPDGTLVYDARLGDGHISYRAYRAPWDATGIGTPDVAVRRSRDGATAFVSWNGDTRVARWAVLDADGSTRLKTVSSASRTGFETAVALPRRLTRFRVLGTDRTGTQLTRSSIVNA
jgi:Arylsulfotransferase (ASST)